MNVHTKKAGIKALLYTILFSVFSIIEVYGQPMTITYTGTTNLAVGVPVSLIPTITGAQPTTNGQTTITLAGTGSPGWQNGPTDVAEFDWPLSTAVDAFGNVYVADSENHSIRKITPLGAVTNFAGAGYSGYRDGLTTDALFFHPSSLAIDASGNVFVCDQKNNRIRKITPGGQVSTYAGSGTAGSSNGTSGQPLTAQFNSPAGLCFDNAGNLYIGDYANNKIRRITPTGLVTNFAGTGTAGASNGPKENATFFGPMGLAADAQGNIYVADRRNYLIRKIQTNGQVVPFAGNTAGFAVGTGTQAKFDPPNHLAIDGGGNIFVADQNNHQIRKIDPTGYASTFAGAYGSAGLVNGTGGTVRFSSPFGLSLDSKGNIYVADYNNHSIRKIIRQAFTISPQLPAGLTFNESNGTISGTPLSPTFPAGFTITAYNTTHTASTYITIATYLPSEPKFSDENYIATLTPLEEGIKTETQLYGNASNKDKVQTTIQYFDGLGRPMQTVSRGAAPEGTKDLIQPIELDAFGREAKQYSPYASNGSTGAYRSNALIGTNGYANSEQKVFFAQTGQNYKDMATPYSISVFEASPLNRMMETGASGDPWQPIPNSTTGHTNKIEYRSNVVGEVKSWVLSTSGASSLGTYSAGKLFVTISKDENWISGKAGTSEEYKDFLGHTILRRIWKDEATALNTYYIFDDYSNLRYVLPPGFSGNTFTEAESDVNFKGFIYAYHYDVKNRLVERKVPGKDWEFTIYNKLDQVVITQDANQRFRTTQQGSFIKYDALGRIALSGTFVIPNSPTTGQNYRLQLQQLVDDQLSEWETRLFTGSAGTTDYTTKCFPTENFIPLSVNYYDDYANIPDKQTFFIPQSGTYDTRTRGLITASRTSILNSPTNVMKNFVYYDQNGRESISFIQHYKGGSANYTVRNYDAYYTTYNFSDQVTNLKRNHYINDGSTIPNLKITIFNDYEYDHMGRSTKSFQKVVNANVDPGTIPITVISNQEYNQLGQLLRKRLHSDDNGATYLDEISYSYNERGWLKSAISSNSALNFTLNYNAPTLGGTPAYNGNVSEMLYFGKNTGNEDIHYKYDKLNRLFTATSASGKLNESLTYSDMGNILTLTRSNQNYSLLNYSYQNNGLSNQLLSVEGSGFPTRNYQYDKNGNSTSDGGNQTINYNLLDLPQTVVQGTTTKATYFYDADGSKRRSVQSSGTRDYIDGIIYNASNIEAISTEEGRMIPVGTGGGYRYTYDLKDHLGNNRVTITKNSSGNLEVLQEDEYYAFGLSNPRYESVNENRYLYNGKEKQDNLNEQYDYGARFYDPVISRWASIDPLADDYNNTSAYVYVANNPVLLTDPDGMEADTTVTPKPAGTLLNTIQIWDKRGKQVAEPITGFWPIVWDRLSGGREYFDGHTTWLVGTDGKVGRIRPIYGVMPDIGMKSGFNTVYKGVKKGLPYIGKAFNIFRRYNKAERALMKIQPILNNIDDPKLLRAVEQKVLEFQKSKGTVSNVRNAFDPKRADYKEYMEKATVWLEKNAPNWQKLF